MSEELEEYAEWANNIIKALERKVIQLEADLLQSQAREALELLTEMCVTHIGADYSDEIHRRYLIGKKALSTEPNTVELEVYVESEIEKRFEVVAYTDYYRKSLTFDKTGYPLYAKKG